MSLWPLDDPHHFVTCGPIHRRRHNQACREGDRDLPAWIAELDGSSSVAQSFCLPVFGVGLGLLMPAQPHHRHAMQSGMGVAVASAG